MRSPDRGWSIADTVVVLCILAACAFLFGKASDKIAPVLNTITSGGTDAKP